MEEATWCSELQPCPGRGPTLGDGVQRPCRVMPVSGGGGAGTTSSGLMLGKVLLHTLSPAAFISALEGRQSGSSAPVLQIRK